MKWKFSTQRSTWITFLNYHLVFCVYAQRLIHLKFNSEKRFPWLVRTDINYSCYFANENLLVANCNYYAASRVDLMLIINLCCLFSDMYSKLAGIITAEKFSNTLSNRQFPFRRNTLFSCCVSIYFKCAGFVPATKRRCCNEPQTWEL